MTERIMISDELWDYLNSKTNRDIRSFTDAIKSLINMDEFDAFRDKK